MKVKMKVKKWRPEKLKMVNKHCPPELSGELWGVICYYHWYLRAGLEGREKLYFFQKSFEVKKDAELSPEYFPCGGSAWILTWSWFLNFSKVRFSLFRGLFGPFRAQKGFHYCFCNKAHRFFALFLPYTSIFLQLTGSWDHVPERVLCWISEDMMRTYRERRRKNRKRWNM